MTGTHLLAIASIAWYIIQLESNFKYSQKNIYFLHTYCLDCDVVFLRLNIYQFSDLQTQSY